MWGPSLCQRRKLNLMNWPGPASARFLQYECIPVTVSPAKLRGNSVCRSKDQNRLVNRWILALEARVPTLFPRLKKAVIARKIERLAKRRSS